MRNLHTEELIGNFTFESMPRALSAELVNLSLESIDVAIESSLKALAEFFDPDRCRLGELLPHRSKIIFPYFYSIPDLNIPQTTDVGDGYLSFVYGQNATNEKASIDSYSICFYLIMCDIKNG